VIPRLVPQRWRFQLWLYAQRLREWDERYMLARRPRAAAATAYELAKRPFRDGSTGVDRLGRVVVINLRERADRMREFQAEAERMQLDVERFDAIKKEDGILGCTLSHMVCLQQMLDDSLESMLVCEDDARFTVSRRELDVLVDVFLRDARADVACLAFRSTHGRLQPYSSLYLRGYGIATTACYLVKPAAARDLVEMWDESVDHLVRGADPREYRSDAVWKHLQERRVFLVPVKRAVRQRWGFSDIERRDVSYDF
jgi:glycosyl transferase, family 25